MDESKEELHVKGQEPITEEEGQAQQAEDAPTEKKGMSLTQAYTHFTPFHQYLSQPLSTTRTKPHHAP